MSNKQPPMGALAGANILSARKSNNCCGLAELVGFNSGDSRWWADEENLWGVVAAIAAQHGYYIPNGADGGLDPIHEKAKRIGVAFGTSKFGAAICTYKNGTIAACTRSTTPLAIFKRFIERNGIGTVALGSPFYNPNSGNYLMFGQFCPNKNYFSTRHKGEKLDQARYRKSLEQAIEYNAWAKKEQSRQRQVYLQEVHNRPTW